MQLIKPDAWQVDQVCSSLTEMSWCYAQAHKKELGEDIDISNYIAGGIVVFNLRTRTVKWQQHLDLSTDRTAFKAYAQASPTLADINGDGKLEVIVGTDMVRPLSSCLSPCHHPSASSHTYHRLCSSCVALKPHVSR